MDGQRYTLNRKRNGTDGVTKTYWICVVPGYLARLVLHEQTVKNSPNHNHDEQRAEILVHRSKKTMEERAATSDTSTKRILAEVLSGLDFECRANLGCRTNSLSQMVRTARAAANRQPTNPISLEFLSISPPYLNTATGDPLLLWDSGYSSSLRRSYLFGAPSNVDVLGSCANLVIDGTFKVAPNLFTQLLTVHGITPDNYRLASSGVWSSPWKAARILHKPTKRTGSLWTFPARHRPL